MSFFTCFFTLGCSLGLLLSTRSLGIASVGATTPFTSFEAESGLPSGGAAVQKLITPPTDAYSSRVLEASGHAFVQLTATGQALTWTNTTTQSFTALNLRYAIPDAPGGGGIDATLNLYVDGVLRQSLNLNSHQTWLYENSTNYNGNDQNPADGLPRVFYDDVHVFLAGAPLAPGSRLTLQKDPTNAAAFYDLDVIDLETPPAPLSQPPNSLAITDYGAIAGDTNADNSNAIQSCLNAAQAQGRSVWIPPGVFYVKTLGGLNANGITIQGAGMWYSTIYRKVPLPNATPLGAIFNVTSCTVRNFALDANATSRASLDGCGGGMDTSGVNWLADSIWTQHTMSGFWASGVGGTVQNCRLQSIWADGINLNNVSLNNTVGMYLTNRNNFVRGTGDDANAINSVNNNGTQYYQPMQNVTIMNTTAIAPWGGKGVAIYGGANHWVQDNYMSDTARYVGLGVMKFGVNGSDLTSATVIGNVVERCGGNGYEQQQQAMMVGNGGDGQGVGTVANAYCVSNIIRNALYSAIGFSATTNLVLQRNIIESPGLDAITIGPPGIGAGIFGLALLHSNLVSGLIAGHLALTNAAAGFAAVVPVSAANCEIAAGPVTEPCAEGGLNLTGLTNGSYAAYGGLSLTSLNGLVVRAASAGSGGIVEVRLDAPGGTLIGRCPVTGSGGWQSYRNYYTQLTNTTGVHTVFLVFTGGTGNLFNLEYFGIFVVPPVPSHQLLPGNTYALKSGWNGQYVSATNNGGNVLAAQASSPAVPAQFQIYDAGGGNIGLLALVNTNFVCADNNGNNPLIANRTGVGSWETFAEFDAGNGQVALRAMVNGRYVTVSNNAAATLIAKSTAIGVSESLSWQFLTGVPPATPGGLSATAGNGRIQLAWTAVPGAVSYTLRRAASYAGNYGVLASNLTASSFTDSNVVNGVTQYYVVSAVNPAGESTNSLPTTAVPGTLERWRWLVTASSSESGGSPASAVDGNINTRWSTGAQQANGQWYQIDLGQLQTFRGVILDAGSSANDYPRSYQVLVSTNGTIWSGPVASGSGTAGSTTINFTTQSARFLRINQTGSAAGTWWSVHELNILAAPPAGVPGLTGSALPIVAAQLSWNPAVSAAGYNLRRAGTSGGPYTLVAANLGDTNYTDTAVNAGVPDYYVVAATNAYGEGPVTQEMMVRPVAFAPPVLMVQTVNGSRQVSWPADHTGWRLQLQTNDLLNGLGTNWLTVSGSTATNQLALPAAGSPSGFYRLIYP